MTQRTGDDGSRVILCGPFPSDAPVGGYARCNDLLARSVLGQRFGIRRLRVSEPREGGLLWRLATDLRAARRCLDACPAPIFHLTAQYQTGTWREWALFRMARRAGRAFVLDIRAGCFVASYERPVALLERRLLDAMLRGASALCVEGRSDGEWIRERFGREPLWLPNFVLAADTERRAPARLERPAAGEPLRLAYAGRLAPEKGLDDLVGACERLAAGGRRVHLDLAGSGEAATVEALARRARAALGGNGVTLHGVLSHDALLDRLASAHCFVFPSRWRGEGHSNAVNEAMQAGLPVVTTTQGFLADVVTAECGARVPPGDPDALARAVATLADDWERLRAAGRAARERVLREFSDRAVLPRLASLYEKLLAEPPR